MKPAARACWRPSAGCAGCASHGGLRALVALLLLAAAFCAAAQGDTAPSAARHFTQARVLAQAVAAPSGEPPRRLDAATLAGQWQQAALPYTWPRAVVPDGAGAEGPWQVTWVEFDLRGATLPQAVDTYLYLPRWQTIGRIAVYADDRLVYRSGGDVVWNGFNFPLWMPLGGEGAPADGSGTPPPSVLRLRIESLASAGGAVSTAWIGPRAVLEPRYQWRRLLQSRISEIMSFAVMGLGLFALLVWLLRRRESIYLLFAVYTLFMALRGLHYYMGIDPLPVPSAWFGWITVNSVNALLVTWYFFVATLVPKAPRFVGRALLVLLAVSWVVTMPALAVMPAFDAMAPLSYLLTILAGVPAVVTIAWAAWRQGSREGILASSVGLVDLPVAIHDWLMQNYMASPEDVYLWPVSTTARLVMFIYIILRRYVGAVDEVERANAHLAQRLHERETELAANYAQLREVQQRETLSRERQRLMQDIHDGMGSQLMSALKVAEAGKLSEPQMAVVLRECIDDLKLTVDSLEPVEADLLLLLATLRYRLLPRLHDASLRLRWEVADVPPLVWLDPRSALHILRILQEGISNVMQHAGATELRVATVQEAQGVAVILTDNGRGFGVRPEGETGRGLSNMARRARAIGAEVSWDAVEEGTRFRLWLPLQRRVDDAADVPLSMPASLA
jgi:signal transduction histidine kinase